MSGVTVSIWIDSLHVDRMSQDLSPEVFFNVNAKLEEQKKTNNTAELAFNLLIETKPNAVKYSVAGTVKLEGNIRDINKKLEANPKTKIPQILFTVYQHVFSSIYLLSSILGTPYPPPDMLHPMQEKILILPNDAKDEATQPTEENGQQASQSKKTPENLQKEPKEPEIFVGKPETQTNKATAAPRA